jgi:hypothetical protein
MTASQFDSLPDDEKRSVLVDILQKREQAVQNLQIDSETKVYNVQYRDGKAGELLEKITRYDCQLRRKDGSYWARIDYYRSKQPDRIQGRVFTAKEAKSELVKSIARDGEDGVNRAITAEEGNAMIQLGKYHYWFDASFDEAHEFPISFLLKHQDAIKFAGLSDDKQQVKISLLYESADGTPFKDFRTLWLDPNKGFMPVRMQRRWEYALDPPFYSVLATEVKKLEQVDGIWFPTHLTLTCTGRVSEEKGYATVYETTAGEIKLGKVTDVDLQEQFADWVAKEKPKPEPGKTVQPAASQPTP